MIENLKKQKQVKKAKTYNKGITLIALVITIIILLILAGVSIVTLTGDSGILTQTEYTRKETKLKISEDKILDKGNGKLTVQYKGYTFNIDIEGKVTEKPNIDYTKLKVEDYVNYQPDNISIGYDKFGELYTGYDNSIVGQDNSLGWRIFNINKDEDIIE